MISGHGGFKRRLPVVGPVRCVGLPPIGRGQAAAPESHSSPATHRQLLAVNLTPPHELPQGAATGSRNGEGRNGPARPQGVPLKP